ncbi:DUF4136 domain-containing protein [Winogradskyella endarachnes]|uniref:DUF4136 domain-containing protein n=1 Tax=Winogradskyella endarachnes TaxID=2681965 RepID=A0A6L6UF41_9FLAO|nr:DUF4136 domain-containing protein [Winogradskyella endarachnes]MUU79562.1 DUF4136 domain-containing protein [Winogradskyella endarachnes]
MKNIIFLSVLLVLTSCGSVVNYDYEKSTDFSNYKTYSYYDDMETGLSELDTKRLMRAIDSELKTMGLTRSDNPDFFIDIQSQQVTNRNNSTVGVGVGGGGGRGFGGVSVGIPVGQNQQTREIIIDFVDETKTGLFWQAVSESKYNSNASPEKREAVFAKLVEKVFAEYPPK